MTKSKLFPISAFILLGSTIVGGCGINGKLGATPATTTAVSASSRSPVPPIVVKNTLSWVAQHHALMQSVGGTAALQGPSTLPGSAPYAATVFLEPINNQYSVTLWETTKPMGINQFNPNQLVEPNGTMRHSSLLRVQHPIAQWQLEKSLASLTSSHQQSATIAALAGDIEPIGVGVPVVLPHGLSGTLYTKGTDPGGTVGNSMTVKFVLWHEAQWTFEAVGANPQAAARTMVRTIRLSRLPRAQSGLVEFINHTSTVISWYQHPYIINFSSARQDPTNLQAALTMVESWRTWSLHP